MSETVATASSNGADVKAPAKAPMLKIRSIVVDTFTAFQKNEVFDKWEDGKVKLDEWKDKLKP